MSNLNRHPVRRAAVGVLAGTLTLTGATIAAGVSPANAVPGFAFERLAGSDRYGTAAAIAADAFPDGVDTAIIARGDVFADALTANYLAGVVDAPILLTASNDLPEVTADALTALGVQNVIIVGGFTAVSAAVEAELAADYDVERLGGNDRYLTAELIAQAAADLAPVGEFGGLATAVLASGQDFPDALALGPIAYAGNHPLLITRPGDLPASTESLLTELGIEQVVIAGQTTAVSAAVETEVEDIVGNDAIRLGGQTRFETATIIAEAAYASFGFDDTHVNLARADSPLGFADALTGGPHAGIELAPIVLTNPTALPPATQAFLEDNAATLVDGHIFGGFAAVSAAVEAAAEAAAQGVAGPVALTSATVAQGGALTGTITGDFSAVTVSGCGLTNQAIGADDNATTAGRQFTLNVAAAQPTGACSLVFTFTPTGGGATFTQTVPVTVTAGPSSPTNATATNRPELVSATVFQTNATGPNAGTVIRYVFDENVTGRAPAADSFFAYSFDGTRYTGAFANVDTASNAAVFVRFTDARLTSATVTGQPAQGSAALRVATVEFGAVADDTFQTRGADAFNPIGDAQLNPGSTTGGATRTFQAGRTAGPDLLSVGNFRPDPLDQTQTLADFTFDEAATVTNQGGFNLVLQNGTTDIAGLPQSGSGTTVVTVVFAEGEAGNLSAANVARGYVAPGTVSDDVDDSTIDNTLALGVPVDPAQGNLNPLQAADAGNSGNSDTPDLVSAAFNEAATAVTGGAAVDAVTFTFDEAVTLPGASTGALFGVYDTDGNLAFGTAGTAQRTTAGNTDVRVEFANTTLFDAVGAFVLQGAVQEDTATTLTSRPNQEDEVDVANANTDTGGTTSTERTAGPDLTGVSVNPVRDVFGTIINYTATYTFDERLSSVANQAAFYLILGDGTRLTSEGASCTVGVVPTPSGVGTQTSNTVTCTDFTGSLTQVNQAVLGSVSAGAVVAFDAGPSNPEGSERTQGASAGTPQQ